MKKEYIKPEMEVETIELESMIALSLQEGDAKTNADTDFTGPLMEGKERNDNWGGLLW